MKVYALFFVFLASLLPLTGHSGLQEDSGEEPLPGEDAGLSGEAAHQTLPPEGGVLIEEPPPSAPEEYIVQPGDTLWDICARFVNNPFYWPVLWSINSYITNPHLIYPGYKIRFGPAKPGEAPTVTIVTEEGEILLEKEAPPPEEEEAVVEVKAKKEEEAAEVPAKCAPVIPFVKITGDMTIPIEGFIAPKTYPVQGRIYKSIADSLNLGEGHIVWIEFKKLSEVKCGDVYSIIKKVKKVRHPENFFKKYGYLYHILGEVEIVDVSEYMATGKITKTLGEIRRGSSVCTRIATSQTVKLSSSEKDITGYVIETLRQNVMSQVINDQIFVDIGSEDGVEVGDLFYVVRKGEEFSLPTRKDLLLPDKVVARAVISNAEENWASAIIVDSAFNVRVGDRVAMKVE